MNQIAADSDRSFRREHALPDTFLQTLFKKRNAVAVDSV